MNGERGGRLPALRIGLAGGVVGIFCCVGPTLLALLGIVSAGTAYAWSYDLYDGYAWWFRLAGLGVMALLVWRALRKRDACSVGGVRAARRKIVVALAVAIGTYAILYAVTDALGRLAVG